MNKLQNLLKDFFFKDKKIQILTKMEELNNCAQVYVIDLSEEYNMMNMCAQFILKTGKPGDKKWIIALNLRHVMFYNENLYDNLSEAHFHRPGQTVAIRYENLGGWSVEGFNGNNQTHATHWEVPEIISYNGTKPNYLYILCTARKMPMYNDQKQLVTQPYNGKWRRDYIAVVDINIMSATYGTIVDRVFTNEDNEESDELHHGHLTQDGRFLIAPGLSSSAINVVSLINSERHPQLYKRIPSDCTYRTGMSNLHTVFESTHLWGSDFIITALSQRLSENDGRGGAGKGGMIMLNNSFEATQEYPCTVKPFINFEEYPEVKYNYDIDTKECHMVMMSSEWTHYGTPTGFDAGFFNPTVTPVDLERYGHRVHIWNLMDKTLVQTLDLRNTFLADHGLAPRETNIDVPNSGEVPLEIRFLHKEMSRIAIVGCVTGVAIEPSNSDSGLKLSNGVIVAVYCPKGQDPLYPTWKAKQVALIPDVLGVIPAITDITLSDDEKCLYVSCWLTGRLIQYDLTKVQDVIDGLLQELPVLSDIWIGGLIYNNQNNPCKLLNKCNCGPNCMCTIENNCGCKTKPMDNYNCEQNCNIYTQINGVNLTGGPQMLRLTPNHQKLYVTGSLYSAWDEQFYGPGSGDKSIQKGSWLITVNTGFINGIRVSPMTVDESFFINFFNEPDGPTRTHELHMRGSTH